MIKKSHESLVKIMSETEIEKDFVPRLKQNTHGLFVALEEISNLKTYPRRDIIFSITNEVEQIETFLDDYGATHNKTFFYFRKLIASVRWINIVIFQGLHILARIDSYNLSLETKEKNEFVEHLKKTVNKSLEDLKVLSDELIKEAKKIGIRKPRAKFAETKNLTGIQKKILPPDINETAVKATQEAVTDILVKFLENSELFNSYFCHNVSENQYSEEVLERFRSAFNRLESLYDTYLSNTEIEKTFSDLKGVRSCIAVTLHLLEMGKALAHFYERHGQKLKEFNPDLKMHNLDSNKEIKQTIGGFFITYSVSFLDAGKGFAEKIFKTMGKDADEFIYTTKLLTVHSYRLEDFHLRPIMPVTQIAGKYKLDTFLYQNRNKYNLKSSLEMAIAIPDIRDDLEKSNIEMMLQGPRKAVEEISKFFNERCGAEEKPIVCNSVFSKTEI